jgi:ABC-type uncharacterized transport system substrate-binding protein
VSYSSNRFEAGRRTGNYTGRILKGAKPAELPIMLPSLDLPATFLARADEVIE